MPEAVQQTHGSTVLRVHVKPRASKSRVLGFKGDALEVSVAAPPVDGQANAELIRTLAHEFGLPRSRVEVLSGSHGRVKLIRLNGVPLADVQAKLGLAP